jgi:predicted nucleic acid-binding protein
MAVAILDTTVLIHLFRKQPDALAWFRLNIDVLAITPITWMEVMFGSPNKRTTEQLTALLQNFEMIYLTPEMMDWAMQQMVLHRHSKGVGIMDCFNASVTYYTQLPIYTHNQKDYLKLLDPRLVIKPY